MPVGSTYWVEENMFGTALENIRDKKSGEIAYARISIKCSFIHAVHPLGFIRQMDIHIDGEQISPDDAIFVLRRNWIPLRYIPTISDIWWNIAEVAHIYIRQPGGYCKGEHMLTCKLTISTLFNTRTVDRGGIGHQISMTHRSTLTVPNEIIEEELL